VILILIVKLLVINIEDNHLNLQPQYNVVSFEEYILILMLQ